MGGKLGRSWAVAVDCGLRLFWIEEDLPLIGFAVVDKFWGNAETALNGVCWVGAEGVAGPPGDETGDLIVDSVVAMSSVTGLSFGMQI